MYCAICGLGKSGNRVPAASARLCSQHEEMFDQYAATQLIFQRAVEARRAFDEARTDETKQVFIEADSGRVEAARAWIAVQQPM